MGLRPVTEDSRRAVGAIAGFLRNEARRFTLAQRRRGAPGSFLSSFYDDPTYGPEAHAPLRKRVYGAGNRFSAIRNPQSAIESLAGQLLK